MTDTPKPMSDVDLPDVDAALRKVWGVGEKTRPRIIEALRPCLTQRTVDLEVCARAGYAVSPAYYHKTTTPVSWEEAAPPYKEQAINEAKAVLDAAGVPYTEKGGR